MSEDKHSKTEKPTAKKVSEAKSKGSVPRSKEMTSAITLITAMIALYASSGMMLNTLKRNMRDIFGGLASIDTSYAGVHALMIKQFGYIGMMLAPFVLILIV